MGCFSFFDLCSLLLIFWSCWNPYAKESPNVMVLRFLIIRSHLAGECADISFSHHRSFLHFFSVAEARSASAFLWTSFWLTLNVNGKDVRITILLIRQFKDVVAKQNKNLGAFYFVGFFLFHWKRSFVVVVFSFSFYEEACISGREECFSWLLILAKKAHWFPLRFSFIFFLVVCDVIFAPKAVDAAERSYKDGGRKEESHAHLSSQ